MLTRSDMPFWTRIPIRPCRSGLALGLAAAVPAGVLTTSARSMGDVGAEHYWTCADGGIFTDPGCWMQQSVPGPLDTAVFDLESAYVVDFGDMPLGNEALRVRRGSVIFDLTASSYELLGALPEGPSVLIGAPPGFAAELVLLGGSMTGDAVSVGRLPASVGSVRLGSEDLAGMLTAFDVLEIGFEGSGSLTASGASTVIAGDLELGQTVGASGSAAFANAATLQCSGTVTVAEIGVGTMSIRDAAVAWCDRAIVAAQSAGIGTVTLDGPEATWMIDASLDVGLRGTGMLNVRGGSAVTVGSTAFIGTLSTSQSVALGVLEVSGAGSRLSVGADLWIGFSGRGSLVLRAGGRAVVAGTVRHGTVQDNVLAVVLGDAAEHDIEPALRAGAVQAGLSTAVVLDEGYAPMIGDRFVLIETAGSLGPPQLTLPDLPHLEWSVELTPDRLVIEVANVPEDVNADGVVDTDDLITVILNWGPCPPEPADCPGDVNGDGIVDDIDLAMVVGEWM